jgi:hypothetical protein
VKAHEVAGAKTPYVDRTAELSREKRAVAPRQSAGEKDCIQRVVFFDGEDDRVLRQVRRGRRNEVGVAQRRRHQGRGVCRW